MKLAVQLYAESCTAPRPSQVTMTQAGGMLGLTRHTVAKMVRAGQKKLNRCGLIPIDQVNRMLKTGAASNVKCNTCFV